MLHRRTKCGVVFAGALSTQKLKPRGDKDMPVDYKIVKIPGRSGYVDIPVKWIAALNYDSPYHIRFEFSEDWKFLDYRVFQVKPTAIPDDFALETKVEIMREFWASHNVIQKYDKWPKPPPPAKYDDTLTQYGTIKHHPLTKTQTLTIKNKMKYKKSGFQPVYDLILRFNDTSLNPNVEILVDPPIRNEFK